MQSSLKSSFFKKKEEEEEEEGGKQNGSRDCDTVPEKNMEEEEEEEGASRGSTGEEAGSKKLSGKQKLASFAFKSS